MKKNEKEKMKKKGEGARCRSVSVVGPAPIGKMAAARTGGRTARQRAGGNFSRRRRRTRRHGRAAASCSPLALLLTGVESPARPLSPALPLTGVESKASRLLWRRACSALALKRRLDNNGRNCEILSINGVCQNFKHSFGTSLWSNRHSISNRKFSRTCALML